MGAAFLCFIIDVLGPYMRCGQAGLLWELTLITEMIKPSQILYKNLNGRNTLIIK